MERYYFLFALAFVWMVFATVQDLKKREVSNWLNFTLLAFALAYRLIYSSVNGDYLFFLYGLLGVLIFTLLAYGFYYGRVFAGGDAKLLIALGAIMPFESSTQIGYMTIFFLFNLFLIGAVYGIIYSAGVALKNGKIFAKAMKKNMRKYFSIIIMGLLAFLLLPILQFNKFILFASLFILVAPFLYIYLKSVDGCMIRLAGYKDLTEGDWLEQDIRIGGKWIRSFFIGLLLKLH